SSRVTIVPGSMWLEVLSRRTRTRWPLVYSVMFPPVLWWVCLPTRPTLHQQREPCKPSERVECVGPALLIGSVVEVVQVLIEVCNSLLLRDTFGNCSINRCVHQPC